jgi:hypothetical protein
MRAAQIENGKVVNILEVDDVSDGLVQSDTANIGDAFSAGVFKGPPVIPRDAATVKAEMWNAIKIERDRRIQSGGYKVGAKWFHSDTFSRTQQMGLVMIGASIPADLQWKTMDGSFITMTQALAGNVFAAAAASDQAVFAVAETHRVAMEASADPAAYDYSTGWPKIYGE